jgi:hypothetical protein
MGIHTAEVSEDECFGYDECVVGRDAIAFKDRLDEVLGGGGGDVEFRR